MVNYMTREEIEKRINYIFKQLESIQIITDFDKLHKEVLKLYFEYLKLLVQIQPVIPKREDRKNLINGNCYLYALDLPIPNIFKQKYEKFHDNIFGFNVGEIGNYQFDGQDQNYKYPNEKVLLDALGADLEFLKIKSYESDIKAHPSHGGFKVAIFLDAYNYPNDYHFARQDRFGIWTQKDGWYCEKITSTRDIIRNVGNFNIEEDTDYLYVKTLELVKPSINLH